MGTIKTLFILMLLYGINITLQAQDKGIFKGMTLEKLLALKKDNPEYDPVQSDKAEEMQKLFKQRTYMELKKLNLIDSDEFIIDKREWKEICDFLQANNKVSVIRLYFVQFNQKKFGTKYVGLQNHDGKLYILLGYFDGNNKLMGNVYYGMMSVNNGSVEVAPEDFEIMHKDYKDNVKKHINQFCVKNDNTEYLKIDAIDFAVQQGKIQRNDKLATVKFKELKFKLAEVEDSIIPTKNKNYYLKKYKDDIGQLTTLTDAIGMDGNPIDDLDNYDMNSLCPQQCP